MDTEEKRRFFVNCVVACVHIMEREAREENLSSYDSCYRITECIAYADFASRAVDLSGYDVLAIRKAAIEWLKKYWEEETVSHVRYSGSEV